VTILACTGCGATKPAPTGDPSDHYPTEHCGKCPPWICEDCGETSSAADLCPCWQRFDDMPFADVRAALAGLGFDTAVQLRDGTTPTETT
jgi:hypothetical protein